MAFLAAGLWLREEMIEDVVSSRGIVGSVAVVFVPSRRVSGVVQAGHGSLVIEGLTAPNREQANCNA
jgi:hypothetical protein